MRHIDFFSLDVENAELQVLSSLDFSAVTIDVMVVEADGTSTEKDDAVRSLLQAEGFLHHSHVAHNDWFVHSRYDAAKS